MELGEVISYGIFVVFVVKIAVIGIQDKNTEVGAAAVANTTGATLK